MRMMDLVTMMLAEINPSTISTTESSTRVNPARLSMAIIYEIGVDELSA
jgi:hypothetical protein